MAGTAPDVNGIEIEIARRFVSLWKSSRQRLAKRIERWPHLARSREWGYVASWWEFGAHCHESLGIFKASRRVASALSHSSRPMRA